MAESFDDLAAHRRRTMDRPSRPRKGKRAKQRDTPAATNELNRGLSSDVDVVRPEGVWCVTARDVYGDEFVLTKRALMQLIRAAVQKAPLELRMEIDFSHAVAIGELYREAMKLVPDSALDEFVRKEIVRRERARVRANGTVGY